MEWATDEERDRLANEEMLKIFQWSDNEKEKVKEKLRNEGYYMGGLDGVSFHPEMKAVTKEAIKRIEELQRKYYPEKFGTKK